LTFCMQCCGHPRDLLSFPTRRSSDLGGKLYYAVLTGDWGTLLSRAGLVFWGGLMGGIVVTGIVIAKKKLPVWRIADVAGICVAAGYAIGRTGCWAVGDEIGRASCRERVEGARDTAAAKEYGVTGHRKQ